MSFSQQVKDATERWVTKKDPEKRALMRSRMIKFAKFSEKHLSVRDKGQVGDRTVIRYWKALRAGDVPGQRALQFRTQDDYWSALKELWPLIDKVGAPPRPWPTATDLPNRGSKIAAAHANNEESHNYEALVARVAQQMQREGHIVWTKQSLQEQLSIVLPHANPDVLSIRDTTVEAHLQPIVHEIKMNRADLMDELKRPEKMAAYLTIASHVYYVLALDAKGRPIATADEVPAEYGVMVANDNGVEILRPAPKQPFTSLQFGMWMALVKAPPIQCQSDQGLAPIKN